MLIYAASVARKEHKEARYTVLEVTQFEVLFTAVVCAVTVPLENPCGICAWQMSESTYNQQDDKKYCKASHAPLSEYERGIWDGVLRYSTSKPSGRHEDCSRPTITFANIDKEKGRPV